MRLDPPLDVGDFLITDVTVRSDFRQPGSPLRITPSSGKKRKKDGTWYQNTGYIGYNVEIPIEAYPVILVQWAALTRATADDFEQKAADYRDDADKAEAQAKEALS